MYPHPQLYSQLQHCSPTTPPNSMPHFNSSSLQPTTITTLTTAQNCSRRATKRSISDESTTEDEELDTTLGGHKSLQMADSNMDNCHMMSRKKRRGMIEKRRRDRINNSLHELKRLVPAAFEKQGSAKLEKAEILQMTVDHLRMLHSKGFDAFSFDPHKFATDYHIIGFRECAAEAARYLVVHEGLDFQDPLRLRLISHLQCYSAQRELSLKSSTGWNPSLFTTPMYAPPTTTSSVSTSSASTSSSSLSVTATSNNTALQASNVASSGNQCEPSMSLQNSSGSTPQHHSYVGSSSVQSYGHYAAQPYSDKLDSNSMINQNNGSLVCNSIQSATSIKSPMSPVFSLNYSSSNTVPSIQTAPAPTNSYSYSYPTAAGTYFAPSTSYMTPVVPSSNQTAQNSAQTNSVKHYRPWGTELAY